MNIIICARVYSIKCGITTRHEHSTLALGKMIEDKHFRLLPSLREWQHWDHTPLQKKPDYVYFDLIRIWSFISVFCILDHGQKSKTLI